MAALASIDANTVSQNSDFQGRVLMRAMLNAVGIYNETPTAQTPARKVLATAIYGRPATYIVPLAQVTASLINTAAVSGFLDTEIDNALATAWNVLAGA